VINFGKGSYATKNYGEGESKLLTFGFNSRTKVSDSAFTWKPKTVEDDDMIFSDDEGGVASIDVIDSEDISIAG
jgi:hypothetical protein